MKVCNTEAMKKIKELERQKSALESFEVRSSHISYKEGEEKTPTRYAYNEVRKKIDDINAQVRHIKHELAVANCSVKVDAFDITIGEALIYLAQLNNEKQRLDYLAENEKLTRRITANGVIEYTECQYDPEQVEKDLVALNQKISDLQVAIDRANLNSHVEI